MTIQSVTVFGQCGRYFLNSGPRSFHEHIGFLAKYMSTTIRLMFCLPLGQKSFLRIPRNQTARPRSRFLLSCIYERFLYSQDWSACLHCIWLQQNWQTDPGNICVNHECENWVTEHYNSFFCKSVGHAVSYLGIHKSESDIPIGFSPDLHLQ